VRLPGLNEKSLMTISVPEEEAPVLVLGAELELQAVKRQEAIKSIERTGITRAPRLIP